MKKIFTLLFASFLSISLFAYDGSRLSISTASANAELKFEIDGQLFSLKNNTITVSYLADGYHQVKIYKEKSKGGFGFGKRQEIIFNSSILLKKGFHTDITVSRFGKVMTDERLIDIKDEWYQDSDDSYDSNDGGWSGAGYTNVMQGREFEILKDQLRKEWFEKNRLMSAKIIIGKTYFTTQQVKDLMLLFTFESNRLELAKFAYNKTVDPKNFYKLNEALTFSSSKEDLARFIRDCE